MIDPEHVRLSLVRQCALAGISRSSWYYRPAGEREANLRLMRAIDALHLSCPWYGSRQMARALRRMGYGVGRKRVRRLMRVMGLRSLAPKPNTSRRAAGHRVYPYLLRDLAVERPDQAWCASYGRKWCTAELKKGGVSGCNGCYEAIHSTEEIRHHE